MTTESPEAKLLRLLEPRHQELRVCARSLCKSRADGDDLFQDAALRAQDKIADLRDERAFRWWFYRILLSVHRNRSRSRFWNRMTRAPMPEVEASADDVEGSMRMRSALASLDAGKREAIVLHDLCGLSVSEVAQVQGVRPSTVKSRLSRGRGQLRTIYTKRFSVGDDARDRTPSLHGGLP